MKTLKQQFCIVPVFILLTGAALFANVDLPSVLGDNMVLQRNTNVNIWGWADPAEAITVEGSWGSGALQTTADEKGEWLVKLPTGEAGGPYTLTVTGNNTVTVNNILLGEIWMASGQSNMELPMQSDWYNDPDYAAQEIPLADYPGIRMFRIQNVAADEPRNDVTASWNACSPASVKNYSAVAYFFAKDLHLRLNVPVGIIETSWGGAACEAFTSAEGLLNVDNFHELAHNTIDFRDWEKNLNIALEEESSSVSYMDFEFNSSDWDSVFLPQEWDSAGLPGHNGTVWFRKEIDLPEIWQSKTLVILFLGPIESRDITWFNGVKIGQNIYDGHASDYLVPDSLIKAGKNTITVQMTHFNNDQGIYGGNYKMRIYPIWEPSNSFQLQGFWKYKTGITFDPQPPSPPDISDQYSPMGIYNSKISPMVNMTIQGVIWYQGETNVGRHEEFMQLFPAMVRDWRKKWGQGDFPFYYAQLAPWNGNGGALRYMWEAQRECMRLNNTGMVVTTDLVKDITDIHPTNKHDVGWRFARWARAKIYGETDLTFSGPLYKSMQVEGDSIRLFFDHAEKGLLALDGPLQYFNIAAADKIFKQANAWIEGETVVVYSSEVQDPVAVRFAWLDTAQPNFFNSDTLPASPFRTDSELVLSVKQEAIPLNFKLGQNYPNPFNPQTHIRFNIDKKMQVSLKIFDAAGREIRLLVNESLSAGEHFVTWDGKNNNNKKMSSGIYFYQLHAGQNRQAKKMLLIE